MIEVRQPNLHLEAKKNCPLSYQRNNIRRFFCACDSWHLGMPSWIVRGRCASTRLPHKICDRTFWFVRTCLEDLRRDSGASKWLCRSASERSQLATLPMSRMKVGALGLDAGIAE